MHMMTRNLEEKKITRLKIDERKKARNQARVIEYQ